MKSIAEQSEEGTEKALTKFQQWCKDTFGDGRAAAELNVKVKELTDIVTARDAKILELTNAATAHATALAAKDKEISDLTAKHTKELADEKASVDLKANAKFREFAAAQGLNPDSAPKMTTSTTTSTGTYDETVAAAEAETNPAKKHALVMKARELRNKK